MTRRRSGLGTLAFLATALVASPAFATQPCPPGSSPWHFWTISGFALYVAVALAAVAYLVRRAVRATTRGRTVAFAVSSLLALVVLAVGGLMFIMFVSWSGTCV